MLWDGQHPSDKGDRTEGSCGHISDGYPATGSEVNTWNVRHFSPGGVSVQLPSEVRFCGAAALPALGADAPDFSVRFDETQRKWTVAWKWAEGVSPQCLTSSVPQYFVPSVARQEFDDELDTWIANGWLLPYDERRLGPPLGLVLLMAVQQSNKAKVRPVLDYRELNGHLTTHAAEEVAASRRRRSGRRPQESLPANSPG